MRYPKLESRHARVIGRTQRVITDFRGYDARPAIPEGMWRDEENLSHDRYPLMSVRKRRLVLENPEAWWKNGIMGILDMSSLSDPDNEPVILDGRGVLHVGFSTVIDLYQGVRQMKVLPETDIIYVYDQSAALESFGDTEHRFSLIYNGRLQTWLDEESNEIDLEASGLRLFYDGFEPESGRVVWFQVREVIDESAEGYQIWSKYRDLRHTLTQMGSFVIVWPDRIWVNLAEVWAGSTAENVAWGHLDHEENWLEESTSPTNPLQFTLTLCDIDGNPYTGSTISDNTPGSPSDGDLWLNTRDGNLQKYDGNAMQWVVIPSTYVKIEHDGIADSFYAGDGLAMNTSQPLTYDVIAGTPTGKLHDSIYNLLNTFHVVEKTGNDWIMVAGIILGDGLTFTLKKDGDLLTNSFIKMSRRAPDMDYITVCNNRLWGCRYGPDENGQFLNEIYASKLGDPRNWQVFEGLSTDSYAASRGATGPFTGAITYNDNPLFFRENGVEKVFPSASGAHQIVYHELDGVESGSSASIEIIDDKLYYKSRSGIMCYTGSLPALVSPQFGENRYQDAIAGKYEKKYLVSMLGPDGRRLFVLDTRSGIWHKEDSPFSTNEPWNSIISIRGTSAAVNDQMGITILDGVESANDRRDVRWYAESGYIGLDIPERKRIHRLRFRYRLEMGAEVRVYLSHDDGPWLLKARLMGNRIVSETSVPIPRTCDRLRYRLEGRGGFELQSMSYLIQKGGDV